MTLSPIRDAQVADNASAGAYVLGTEHHSLAEVEPREVAMSMTGAGQVILSGALGPMRPVTPGATVTASITGLGTVSCTFTQEEA
ncbi:MAG: hypothetical protein WCS84_15715 [Nocardioides sp.]|jgi:2-keto-4-pentenoate hydratase